MPVVRSPAFQLIPLNICLCAMRNKQEQQKGRKPFQEIKRETQVETGIGGWWGKSRPNP